MGDSIMPAAGAVNEFWVLIAFFSSVAVNIVTIIFLVSNRKERREVSFAPDAADKQEFDRHVEWNLREHENLVARINEVAARADAKLEHKLEQFIRESNESRALIHARINDVLEAVSELRGEVRAGK